MRFDNAARRYLVFLALGAFAAVAQLPAARALAQEAAQKTFQTAQQAADALMAASRDKRSMAKATARRKTGVNGCRRRAS